MYCCSLSNKGVNNKCQTNIDPLIKLKERALIIVHLGRYHGSTHEFFWGDPTP